MLCDHQHRLLHERLIKQFEPSVDEMKIIAPQIYINQKLSFERLETDIVVDGVTLKNVMRYKDKRVQSVFDGECERRMM